MAGGAGGRPKAELVLTEEETETLQRWARRPKSSQFLALRSRIVLACGRGLTNTQVAQDLNVTKPTVGKWRKRFLERRLDGLLDEPRPGAPRKISDAQVEQVITKTLESKPPHATHWSTRSMAQATGLSQTAISRIWRAFSLQPHRTETFKLSTDPLFIDKVRDVVGLYMSPPENAVVLCIDEKSQVQALDRTQPLLPLEPGRPERHTHDYARHGTTSLFAAWNVATGEVIGRCDQRHRHQEFLKFLNQIDQTIPEEPGVEIHLVMDNYATHKTPRVQRWLAKRPRYHVHFTPTSASWLNQVERFFAEITAKRIRRGAFRSVPSLEKAIMDYVAQHNQNPRPFQWTADADLILGRVANVCKRINNSGY
ncbi:MAG: IS630 family transposase [Planctomycetaceae bacterium]|nr:IS630 family transposase [Planctomycetaceae bacterium]MBX3452834.1 IS630 family transposase [Planctomycetaceae bacterium]